uniref:(California timema) hypothetical protein n=1 Tax=Timema californicum TaxID=61474 RepID=A0A7R9JIZ3_TIMCA|nr:unnamed protein product [Timema californicum]
MFQYNTCLTELHLQKMNFSDHDIELLVLGLVYNRSLLLLDLCCNNIADDGIAHLGSYLKLGPPLRGLMLGHNRITDGGARFLSFTTPYSKLFLLDIAHNELTDAGILDILNSIKKAYPLGILYVWGNSITRTSCKVVFFLSLLCF